MNDLHILMLEDLETDAELIRKLIIRNIPTAIIRITTNKREFLAALQDSLPDIVLSDYSLPSFTGLEALLIAHEKYPELPFIIVTGSVNEETAVECMKAGADDYILKDRMNRLVPAIEMALKKRRLEKEIQSVEEDALINKSYFEGLFQTAPLAVALLDNQEIVQQINQGFTQIFHYTAEEACGKSINDLIIPPEYKEIAINITREVSTGNEIAREAIRMTKEGSRIFTMLFGKPVFAKSSQIGIYAIYIDITYRKRVEELLKIERDLSIWLSSADKLKAALQYVIDKCCTIEGVDAGGIYLKDQKADILQLISHKGLKPEFVKQVSTYDANTPNYILIEKGKPVFSSHPQIVEAIKSVKLPESFKALAILPLSKDNQPFGCINLVSRTLDEFEPELQNVLVSISTQVSHFISKLLAESSLKQMFKAVEQSPAEILITDKQGNIEYVNPKFTQVTGYTKQEVIGKNPRIFKSGNLSAEEYKILWTTILSGKEWRGEFLNRKKDNTLYWESASISPILTHDGTITNFIAVKEDISNKKTLQEELIQSKERAEESDRVKSMLISLMSHEFRTSLMAILGFANVLRMETKDSKQSAMLDNILVSGDGLKNTLDSILTLIQLEGTLSLNTEHTDLQQLLNELSTTLEKKLTGKGLKFIFNSNLPHAMISADPNLLKTAFEKITDYAFQSTDKGTIILSVSKEVKEGSDYYCVKVNDTSKEIPAQDLIHLFDPFRQGSEAMNTKFDGASLGLSIAGKIIQLSDGKIELHSTPGVGNEFVVSLPCLQLKDEQHKEKTESEVPFPSLEELLGKLASPPRVLLVEDNEMNAILVLAMLKKICDITHAFNGELAIQMAKDKQFDLVLMDINLGAGLNGMQTTQEMKKLENYKHVPFAAVTGYTLKEEKDKIFTSGLSFYLGKPFKKEELFELIREMVYHMVQS